MQFSYKIKIIYIVCLLTLQHFYTSGSAQVQIIRKNRIYVRQATGDSLLKMINLKKLIPSLVLDLRYATHNNFTGKKLYSNAHKTSLRLSAAEALRQVQAELGHQGLGLKVWDAYRPYSVSKKMWEQVKDERYVADPAKGSNHNRGLAVDITLVDLKDNSELDMGTGFDNFTATAHHSYSELPEPVKKRRQLLKEIMERAGFKALETEWWHYSWPNDHQYEILDIDFGKLRSY